MVAASVSGIDFTSIHPFTDLTGITFTPNANNVTVVSGQWLQFRFQTNGVRQTGSIPIPGAPIDAGDKYWLFWCTVGNYTSPTPQVAFVDSSNRKKMFTVTTQRGNTRYFLIDLSTTNYNTEDSGFDQTSLSSIELSVLGNSGFIDTVGVRFSRIALIDSLVLSGGEIGDTAKIQDVRDYLNVVDSSSNVLLLNFIAASNFLEMQHRLLVDADYFSGPGLSGVIQQDDRLEAWYTVQNTGATFFREINASFREIILDLQNAQTVSDLIVDGYRLSNISTPAIVFSGLTASASPGLDFGSGSVESSTIGSSGVISGGTAYTNVSFSNSTGDYALEWNGTSTFTGVSFSGGSDHYINVEAANFTSGATLDISDVSFGTPGIRKVRVNASGKTLNIQSAGGFTIDDVTVVAGTVNVLAPAPTLTVLGFQPLSNVRISYAGQTLAILNSTSPPFEWEVVDLDLPATVRLIITKAGFETYEQGVQLLEGQDASVTIAQRPEAQSDTYNSPQVAFITLMIADAGFRRVLAGATAGLSDEAAAVRLVNFTDSAVQSAWALLVAQTVPTTEEVEVWQGYLTATGYTAISFNSDGEVS